jgi:hypothetical protein
VRAEVLRFHVKRSSQCVRQARWSLHAVGAPRSRRDGVVPLKEGDSRRERETCPSSSVVL